LTAHAQTPWSGTVFFDGPPPPCPEEGDVDGSGAINVADLTYLVDFLFFDGPRRRRARSSYIIVMT